MYSFNAFWFCIVDSSLLFYTVVNILVCMLHISSGIIKSLSDYIKLISDYYVDNLCNI